MRAVLLSAIVVGAGAEAPPAATPAEGRVPMQVATRRGAGAQAPENTAAAIERSIEDGIDWAEVDVGTTSDGACALIPGPRAAEKTLAEWKRLDVGSSFARRFSAQTVLSLPEALKLASGRVRLCLVVDSVDAARLVRDILDARMERQVVVTGPSDVLRAVRSAPGGEAIALMVRCGPEDAPDSLRDLRPAAVSLAAADLSPGRVRAFRDRDIDVEARALGPDDRPEVWDRALAAGADRLRTDRAAEAIARRLLAQRVPGRVRIALHRGASRYAPENTLPACDRAIGLGADFVEFDVRTTRDGVPILLHDPELERTTSGRGPVREHEAANVATLDAGAWFGTPFAGERIPTLDGFLDAIRRHDVRLYVDAKDVAPEVLAAALERHGLTDRAVVYQHPEYLETLRAVAPNLRRMAPLGDLSQLDEVVARVAPHAVDVKWVALSKPLVGRCHALGIQVFSDALGFYETDESYRRAIGFGVDVIQTDHPLRVLRALDGATIPAPTAP